MSFRTRVYIFFFYLILISCGIIAISGLIDLCRAGDVFDLQRVGIEAHRFSKGSRDAYITPAIPGTSLDQEYNLGLDMSIMKYFFWNNTIYSRTDRFSDTQKPDQFRYVSWEYKFGLHVTSFLDVEYKHRSQHLLDVVTSSPFPVEDGVGVTITIYSNPFKPSSLF